MKLSELKKLYLDSGQEWRPLNELTQEELIELNNQCVEAWERLRESLTTKAILGLPTTAPSIKNFTVTKENIEIAVTIKILPTANGLNVQALKDALAEIEAEIRGGRLTKSSEKLTDEQLIYYEAIYQRLRELKPKARECKDWLEWLRSADVRDAGRYWPLFDHEDQLERLQREPPQDVALGFLRAHYKLGTGESNLLKKLRTKKKEKSR